MSPTSELDLLHRLRQTPELFLALRQAQGSELAVQQSLRKQFDDDLVRAVIALDDARQKAATLLPEADRLWLTRVGLEQSTAWAVAQHKASRFPANRMIVDLCSGIGCDAAALARRGPVTAVDMDSAMLQRCRWNLDVWNPSAEIQAIAADVRSLRLRDELVHVDPDRRYGRDRPTKRLEQYCPDLVWMQQLIEIAGGGAIKLGPASNFMQKFPGCEIELISLHGECREATVWFGSLSSENSFRATVLPSGETVAGDPLSAWCPPVQDVRLWLFDPDPAVVRSGLLDVVSEKLGLQRLDAEDEYLTGDTNVASPFVRPFEVEAVLSSNVRDLKRYLRSGAAADYEIKCRRVSVDASALRRRLPTGSGSPLVIVFARVAGRSRIVLARRPKNAADMCRR